MCVTTAFKRLLRLDDVNVTAVEWFTRLVVVTVVLRRRRLWCPHCGHKTSARYHTRPVASRWRHLDLGLCRTAARVWRGERRHVTQGPQQPFVLVGKRGCRVG